MRITTLSFGRTINLGNYESARIDATAEVEEGESPAEALAKLRAFVEEQARPKPSPRLPMATGANDGF